ncbi:MAG: M6 family metalloprotease domain-containing protein [Anaerolineales bacterium]|nr:M6 family metalloprotease domain-containing protein [Anaerolineales bacterium]
MKKLNSLMVVFLIAALAYSPVISVSARLSLTREGTDLKEAASTTPVEPGSPLPRPAPPHPNLVEKARQGKATLPEQIMDLENSRAAGLNQPNPYAPKAPRAQWKTLAILVKFTDKNSQVSASFFDSLIFGTGSSQLNHYYKEVSYNQLDIVTVNLPSSLGWYTMPSTYATYVNNNYCMGLTYPNNCQKLAEDAVAAANPVVDFSQYDNDGDLVVDHIFIVHAGVGAEVSGLTTDVWSHAWNMSAIQPVDGVWAFYYSTEPEYMVTPGDMTIGVYAHELGHGLGLPDLYDTDYSSEGSGAWSLMGIGTWNGPGNSGSSPAHLDAWSKIQLGWTTPTVVVGTIIGAGIANAENNAIAYRLQSPQQASTEYFLVENRQQTGYDSYLPANGLLIWHVDEAIFQNTTECKQHNNWNCGASHYKVALEQADGSLHLENKTNTGDGGDPYPGTSSKTSFTSATTPNTSSYYSSSSMLLTVTNISASASSMTADLYVPRPPLPFPKVSPSNSATNVSTFPTASWMHSSGQSYYEFCIDQTKNSTCDSGTWSYAGTFTNYPLGNLLFGTEYSWQIRATNAWGSTEADGAWWSFTTQYPPLGDFPKISPANGVVGQLVNGALSWGPSANAVSYEYCVDMWPDSLCQTSWVNVGSTNSAIPAGLLYLTTYEWQVRSVDPGGVTKEADTGTWFTFTTTPPPPIPFNKIAPLNNTTGHPLLLQLTWNPSLNMAYYEYCLDDINNNLCDTSWVICGLQLSVFEPNNLYNHTYYWQVRASNPGGDTYADNGNWWNVTIKPATGIIHLPLVQMKTPAGLLSIFVTEAAHNGLFSFLNPFLLWLHGLNS